MMLNFNNGMVEEFTIVLSSRNQEHKGIINNVSNVVYKRNMNAANELSFTVNKEVDGYVEPLWDEITDLRLIYLKDLNEYFEMEVDYKDAFNPSKSITCTSLCEAELSQTMLYGIEINTDSDIGENATDHTASVLYNPDDKAHSILHRVLSKAPQYDIEYIEPHIASLTKTPEFSVDGTSIYDFLTGDLSEEFDILILFNSVNRKISIYDLETYCNTCGYRGEFSDLCPNKIVDDDGYNYKTFEWNTTKKDSESGDIKDYILCNNNYVKRTVTVEIDGAYKEADYYMLTDKVLTEFDLVADEDAEIRLYTDPLLNTKYQSYTYDTFKVDYDKYDVYHVKPKVSPTIPVGTFFYKATIHYNSASPGKITFKRAEKYKICGSADLDYYGEDTTILVDVDNLTDEIDYKADVGSIKNTFKLEGGDDDMTAAIINANCGNQYIYNFTDEQKADMSDKLKTALETYKKTIDDNQALYLSNAAAYYHCLELYNYYNYTMMPTTSSSIDIDSANDEAQYIIDSIKGISIAVPNSSPSKDTANNAVKTFVKLFAHTGSFDIDLKKSTFDESTLRWTGIFRIENYSNDEDYTYLSFGYSGSKEYSPIYADVSYITISTNYQEYIKQTVQKTIDTGEDHDLYDILSMANNGLEGKYNSEKYPTDDSDTIIHEFVQTITASEYNLTEDSDPSAEVTSLKRYAVQLMKALDLYALTCLDSFTSAYSKALSIIDTQMGKYSSTDTTIKVLRFWRAFYAVGAQACQQIYAKRDAQVKEYIDSENQTDSNGDKITRHNITYNVLHDLEAIKKLTDFQTILGDTYNEFCSFRREDTYSNDNYISDDLENDELFENAQEFLEVANKELIKSSTYQYSISSTLHNLLLIPEFEPLTQYFEVGNWLRFNVGDNIYRLRLISYEINFDSIQDINCEFSELTRTADGYNDIQSVLSQASSMASSYGTVSRQASNGQSTANAYNDIVKQGLNSGLINITNNVNEEFTMDSNGITGKSWDDITETYSDEQIRITHNILCFTDDDWKTSSLALGKHTYYSFNGGSSLTQKTAYGLTAQFVTTGVVYGSEMIAGDIYSADWNGGTKGSHIHLGDSASDPSSFNLGGGSLTFSKTSGLTVEGKINADSGYIGGWNISTTSDKSLYYGSLGSGAYLSPYGIYGSVCGNNDTWRIAIGNNFGVNSSGKLYANSASISGDISASSLRLYSSTTRYGSLSWGNLTDTSLGTTYNDVKLCNDNLSGDRSISLGFKNPEGSSYAYTTGFATIKTSGNSIINRSYSNLYFGDSSRNGYIGSGTYGSENVIWAGGARLYSQNGFIGNLEGKASSAGTADYATSAGSASSAGTATVSDYSYDYSGSKGDAIITHNSYPENCGETHINRISGFLFSGVPVLAANGAWSGSGSGGWNTFPSSASDKRLKDNIANAEIDALSLVNTIKIRQFDWKSSGHHQKIGMVADELQTIDPDLVIDLQSENVYKTVNIFYLEGYLTKAIQELSAKVDELETLITSKN